MAQFRDSTSPQHTGLEIAQDLAKPGLLAGVLPGCLAPSSYFWDVQARALLVSRFYSAPPFRANVHGIVGVNKCQFSVGHPHAMLYKCKGSFGVRYRNALAPCLAHARALRSLHFYKALSRYYQTSCRPCSIRGAT